MLVTKFKVIYNVVSNKLLFPQAPAVVMITKLREKQTIKCEAYLPPYTATYQGVTVTVMQLTQRSGYSVRNILLKVRGNIFLYFFIDIFELSSHYISY